MDADRGYDYTVALCAAIEDATSAVERARPDAYAYRGRTLRYALERVLYVALVNDRTLYELFRQSRSGGHGPRVRLRSRIEREIGRLTCGGRAAGRVTGTEPPAFRRVSGKLRATARRASVSWRRRSAATSLPELRRVPPRPTRHKPVCIVLHHPKFLRFVQPVVASLPSDEIVVLSREAELRADVEALGLGFALLQNESTPGRAFAAGSGLAEHPDLMWQFDGVVGELERLRARCTVVLEGNHPLDEIVNQACKLLDIPCICLQQGWSPFVHNGFRHMSFSTMLVWGDGFAELLAPHNPDQIFVVTGNPALDTAGACPANSDRDTITFFLQNTSQLIALEHLEEMHELIQETARRFPYVRVLVRPHPSGGGSIDTTPDMPNVSIVSPNADRLRDLLVVSSAVVSIYSTTLLEAAALLVPAIAYNVTSLPHYVPDLAADGAAIEVRDRPGALAALERLLADDSYKRTLLPGMTVVRDRFFAGVDGHAAERIAAHIAAQARLDGDSVATPTS